MAELVHSLFTRFDKTVEKHRLFKMDTVPASSRSLSLSHSLLLSLFLPLSRSLALVLSRVLPLASSFPIAHPRNLSLSLLRAARLLSPSLSLQVQHSDQGCR